MILYAGSYTEMVDGDFGGYGQGVYCFLFNAITGSLTLLHTTPACNPSYLCVTPQHYLYTHTEVVADKAPVIKAYRVAAGNYALQFINQQPVNGGCPCQISFCANTATISAACYQTGNALVYPTGENGALLPHKANVQHVGRSINATRQQQAHTHFITSVNAGKQLLVADLGIDSILVYNHAESGLTLAQTVQLPPGSGPRHLAANPVTGVVFVVNELTGTVAVLAQKDGVYTVASIAASFTGAVDITPSAAAIRVSANGRFVYVSERGDNHLSVFAFNHHTNMLTLLSRYPTMGKTPRDFILDPSNSWLLVAHQHSDDITVFKADTTTGKLEFHHQHTGVLSPVCFAWLP